MDWPYKLLDLTQAEKHERRLTLDRYAVYSQLSAFVPIIVYRLYCLAVWVFSERKRAKVQYSAVPGGQAQAPSTVAKKIRSLKWWLEGQVASNWGLRIHWLAGGLWMVWLLFLCVHNTGQGMSCSNFTWSLYFRFCAVLEYGASKEHYDQLKASKRHI